MIYFESKSSRFQCCMPVIVFELVFYRYIAMSNVSYVRKACKEIDEVQ